MNKRTTMAAWLAMALVTFSITVLSGYGDGWLAADHGSKANVFGAFTVTYTNATDARVALGSVMAMSASASNTWNVYVVEQAGLQTNLITSKAMIGATNSIIYDGMGNVPVGSGCLVLITGYTGTTNPVYWTIGTLSK